MLKRYSICVFIALVITAIFATYFTYLDVQKNSQSYYCNNLTNACSISKILDYFISISAPFFLFLVVGFVSYFTFKLLLTRGNN